MGEEQQSYIVKFKKDTSLEKFNEYIAEFEKSGGKITHKYTKPYLGFSAAIPKDQLRTFEVNEHVDYIEPDGIVRTN